MQIQKLDKEKKGEKFGEFYFNSNVLFGRSVHAKIYISFNDRLISFSPTIRTIGTSDPESPPLNRCQSCSDEFSKLVNENNIKDLGGSNRIMWACPHCKLYRYCSSECCLDDWKQFHRFECSIIRMYQGITKTEYADSFVRLVVRTFVCCHTDENLRKEILTLESHVEEANKQPPPWMEATCANIMNSIIYSNKFILANEIVGSPVRVKKDDTNGDFSKYILQLMCINLTNSNSFFDVGHEKLGEMLDPTFSLINHSCLPNSILLKGEGLTNDLIATSDIKKDDEVYITYCSTTFPTPIRKSYLKEKFFFDCTCKLCTQNIDIYFSYNCDTCNNVIYSLELEFFFRRDFTISDEKYVKCNHCQRNVPTKILQKVCNIHRKILGLIIFDITFPISTEEEFNEFEDDFENIIGQLYDLPLDVLVELILPLHNITYEIKPGYAFIANNFLEELELFDGFQYIPYYCFPLNILIPSISTYFEDISTKKTLLTYLTIKFKSVISCEFAPNITSSTLVLYNSYLSMGQILATVAYNLLQKMIKRDRRSFRGTKWHALTDIEVFETLMKTSQYFCIRALQEACVFEKYLGARRGQIVFNLLINLTTIANASGHKELIQWQTQMRCNVNNIEFHKLLKLLFDLLNIKNIRYKKSKAFLQRADRKYVDVFTINPASINYLDW